MHRFVWDLHFPPPQVEAFTYPIAAVPGDTPRLPTGPWVLPGRYTVTLIAGDARVSQAFRGPDGSRVKTAPSDLEQQFTLSVRVCDAIGRVCAALPRGERRRAQRARRVPPGDSTPTC